MTTFIRYSIGTKFKSGGKNPRECTVIDIYRTYNSENELVKLNYVAVHDFLGQKVTDREVCQSTIDRGLISQGEIK